MFIRTESFKTFIRLYPVTALILLIDLAVYFFLFACTYFNIDPSLALICVRLFARTSAMLDNGWWWQLITPIFLHTDFVHVLFNTFTLFIFAPALESMLGKVRFSIAFLGTGLISNALSILIEPTIQSYGASTSLYGLFGLYLFLIVFRSSFINRQDRLIVLVFLGFNLILSFVDSSVDHIGHLTGLMAGLALAPMLCSGRIRTVDHK
ncbi:MAG: rhomboid family intramembrane serine protease [Sporolactobacillus sp.]